MTRSKKRSSRMESRNNRRPKRTPAILQDPTNKDKVILANRAARRQHASYQAHAAGQSVRQEQNDKRKTNQTAARRALRKMRKETQAAMRGSV